MRQAYYAVAAAALLGAAAPSQAAAPPSPTLNVGAIYQGTLLIKLLDLRMHSGVAGQHFKIDAHATSSGAVSFVRKFDIDAGAYGAIVRGQPVPAAYVQRGLEGQKHTGRTLVWKSPPPAPDPLTQVLRQSLTTAASPCPAVLPVFDGKQRYDLILTPAGGGALDAAQHGFGLTQAVQCRMGFRPISGFRTSSQDGLHKFTRGDIRATFAKASPSGLWIATDVSVDTLVGAAHLRLIGLSIQGSRAALAGPAASRNQPQSRSSRRMPG
jgi:hypothetical protein